MNEREPIYLDHAATTAAAPEAVQAMLPYFTASAGNPSSVHAAGRRAREAVERARRQTAAALGADASEIFFTSGGTESDNWAITGAFSAALAEGKRPRIITAPIEHHAVLHTCARLEKQGAEIVYLPVGRDGTVRPEDLMQALTPDTALVSVMTANNETGAVQPVRALARICKESGVLFHTDAVQAVGTLPIDAHADGIDLLSLSAHKFRGPKGIGALYIRRGARIADLIRGGAQERGRRAGTENVPGIVGLGAAIELAVRGREANAARQLALRGRLERGILRTVPGAWINAAAAERLPGHCNVTFPGIGSEALVLRLDLEGVCVSGGSACTAGSLDPSHVLLAMGLSREEAKESVRFTVGPENTEAEIDRVLSLLPRLAAELRRE